MIIFKIKRFLSFCCALAGYQQSPYENTKLSSVEDQTIDDRTKKNRKNCTQNTTTAHHPYKLFRNPRKNCWSLLKTQIKNLFQHFA